MVREYCKGKKMRFELYFEGEWNLKRCNREEEVIVGRENRGYEVN